IRCTSGGQLRSSLFGELEGGVGHRDVRRSLRFGYRREVGVDGRHVTARRGTGQRGVGTELAHVAQRQLRERQEVVEGQSRVLLEFSHVAHQGDEVVRRDRGGG